jgi:CxxC-x17-CxxC domain-containing protein
MGKFGHDDRFGKDRGGDRFGKKSFGGGFGGGRGGFGGARGPSDRPQMHSAVCGECGNPCEVPFRPVDGRPVFCNNCFRKQKDAGAPSFGKPAGDRFSRPRFDRPSAPTPVTANLSQFKEQLEMLNVKLDRILRALAPVESGASVAIVEPKKSVKIETMGTLSLKTKAKIKKVSVKKKK